MRTPWRHDADTGRGARRSAAGSPQTLQLSVGRHPDGTPLRPGINLVANAAEPGARAEWRPRRALARAHLVGGAAAGLTASEVIFYAGQDASRKEGRAISRNAGRFLPESGKLPSKMATSGPLCRPNLAKQREQRPPLQTGRPQTTSLVAALADQTGPAMMSAVVGHVRRTAPSPPPLLEAPL